MWVLLRTVAKRVIYSVLKFALSGKSSNDGGVELVGTTELDRTRLTSQGGKKTDAENGNGRRKAKLRKCKILLQISK